MNAYDIVVDIHGKRNRYRRVSNSLTAVIEEFTLPAPIKEKVVRKGDCYLEFEGGTKVTIVRQKTI